MFFNLSIFQKNFLERLQKRGPKAFEKFLFALQSTNQLTLYHQLLNATNTEANTHLNGSSGSIKIGDKRKQTVNIQSPKRSKFELDFDSLCSNIGIEVTQNNLFESLTTSQCPNLDLKQLSLEKAHISLDQMDKKGLEEKNNEDSSMEYKLNECDIIDGPNEEQLVAKQCSVEVGVH